jgi:hypothetical protein
MEVAMSSVATAEETLLQQIRLALSGIRYGSVEITIHDSKVVQIERKEKLRLEVERSQRG